MKMWARMEWGGRQCWAPVCVYPNPKLPQQPLKGRKEKMLPGCGYHGCPCLAVFSFVLSLFGTRNLLPIVGQMGKVSEMDESWELLSWLDIFISMEGCPSTRPLLPTSPHRKHEDIQTLWLLVFFSKKSHVGVVRYFIVKKWPILCAFYCDNKMLETHKLIKQRGLF